MPRAPRVTKVPEIRTGDTVVLLAGKDAGKRGVVERVLRDPRSRMMGSRKSWRPTSPLSETSVVVTGLNISKRHQKGRPPRPDQTTTGRVPASQMGGIIDIAQPVAISKVMLICPEDSEPTRIGHVRLPNGDTVRVCRHGHQLEAKKA
jgi:large subunit ribosomal protein L24